MVTESTSQVKFQIIDQARPDIWPSQSVLSKIQFQIRADDLQNHMLGTDNKTLASWFISMRRQGSGSFLRIIPSQHQYSVSSELYRIQISMRLLAPIPALQGKKCVCGYAGPDFFNGVHFLSSCHKISLTTTRHNQVCVSVNKILDAVRYITRKGENACWIRQRKDLRPFDILYKQQSTDVWTGIDVGIADPTRLAKLTDLTGETHYSSGQASRILASRKRTWLNNMKDFYGGFTQPVNPKQATFEATGAWGKSAQALLRPLFKEAKELGLPPPTSTWSAQTFQAYWSQKLSFDISKFSAMTILNASRAISKMEIESGKRM
jgi:hypothetical protein